MLRQASKYALTNLASSGILKNVEMSCQPEVFVTTRRWEARNAISDIALPHIDEPATSGRHGRPDMRLKSRLLNAAVVVFAVTFATPAWAQRHGGILKFYTLDSPASMSILEETTVFAQRP